MNRFKRRQKFIAAGGTFDRFHSGHARFLKKAFASANHVLIGIVKEPLKLSRRKQLSEVIQSFKERRNAVKKFLKRSGFASRAKMISLKNEFGPALSSRVLDSIVATKDTLGNALKINFLRKKKGLRPLAVRLVKLLNAEDDKTISSTRVRKGEINRFGKVFSKNLRFSLKISDARLAHELKKAVGVLYQCKAARVVARRLEGATKIVVVGDASVQALLREGVFGNVSVVDHRIRRTAIEVDYKKLLGARAKEFVFLKARNPAGFVSKNLSNALRKSFSCRKKVFLEVEGEEDLAVLPCLLFAPLGSKIVYGQPYEGLVLVEVTEAAKEKAFGLIKRFKKIG